MVTHPKTLCVEETKGNQGVSRNQGAKSRGEIKGSEIKRRNQGVSQLDFHRENGITHYQYDNQDRIIGITAPNGVTTQYEYDKIARRTQEINPGHGTLSYRYDLADNLISITEKKGSLIYDSRVGKVT